MKEPYGNLPYSSMPDAGTDLALNANFDHFDALSRPFVNADFTAGAD